MPPPGSCGPSTSTLSNESRLPADGGAEEVGEVGVGSVDVEEANSAAARVRERVDDAGRRDDRRPGGGDDAGLAADGELELALEDVEGVGVALVVVRARARVVRAGVVLDQAELGPRDLDEVRAGRRSAGARPHPAR